MTDLDLSPDEYRQLANETLDRIVKHLTELPNAASCGDLDCKDLCRSLRESPPSASSELKPILDLLFNECIPRSLTTNGRGFTGDN